MDTRRSRLRRSWWLPILIALAIVSLAGATLGIPTTRAALPGKVGPDRVYFPQTGHYVGYAFLDYWRTHGETDILGYPLTDELEDPDTGRTIQYFERAVFEWHPELGPDWNVQLQLLGVASASGRTDTEPFQAVPDPSSSSCSYYPETGHSVCAGFRAFWEEFGGLPALGYPISQEFDEYGVIVQYFERARFEWHPGAAPERYDVLLGRLGADAALAAGVSTAPVPQDPEVDSYDPDLWYIPAPAGPAGVTTPPPGAPSHLAKWIEVDLSTQYVRAWERARLVLGSYSSTGIARYPTPPGTYQIYAKYTAQDMTGGTRGVDYYYLPDVPYVMYFYRAYALHGTYWHANFGVPMSHGCVNLPTGVAATLFNWAPPGTTVWVHW